MLTGPHGLWQIRVGDHWVVYTVDDQRRAVRVTAAGHGRDVCPVDLAVPVTWQPTMSPPSRSPCASAYLTRSPQHVAIRREPARQTVEAASDALLSEGEPGRGPDRAE